jgi:FMN hydrolase / 5-amino-6-(5-phospho-D-ribitylamino)uracil phosphatase
MTAAPAILFDVMDTLVSDPFFDVVPAFFGVTLPVLLEQKHPTAWIEFEIGARTPREYYEGMFLDGRSFDHDAFELAVRGSYRFLDGVEPLLKDLVERQHHMHALSNYPTWYRWIEQKLALSRYVAWSFVSCHTKLRKPDPAAYLNAAESLGKKPEDCLFIDDRPLNCAAAEAVGMQTILFSGASGLRDELTRRRLL